MKGKNSKRFSLTRSIFLLFALSIFISNFSYARMTIDRIHVDSIQQPEPIEPDVIHPSNMQNEAIEVYQKKLLASREHQEQSANDVYHYHAAEDLWEAMRNNFGLEHYEDNPLVQAQINYFLNHQEFLLNAANRAAPFLYYILQEARRRNLPAEVALIPIIESAFNPFAYSSAGAAGIWQMMPNTASGYGIKQNWWYDGRRDVITSTKAALNHIIYLRNFFNNNWLLAIAAYDTGQGNVLSAIKRNIRDGYDTSFWSLPVAHETRDYVPRFLALAAIIAHPEKYSVYFPPVKNAPYLAQVDVGRQIDLKRAAIFAGISLRKLMQLNPGYNRMITGPNGPYRITLPIENVSEFTENLSRLPITLPVNWTRYKVQHGDTLLALAKRFKSSLLALRKINGLHGNHIKPGSNILLPHTEKNIFLAKNVSYDDKKISPSHILLKQQHKDEMTLQNALMISSRLKPKPASDYQLQPGDTIYMTRKGDSLLLIAKRYKIPVVSLIAANTVREKGSLPSGVRLIIPTHAAEIQFAKTENSVQRTQLQPGDTIYMVRQGDTMERIAKRFHTTPPEIRVANLIADNDLHEGDRLVIPTHA